MSGPEKKFELKLREYLESQGCWVLKTYSNGVQRAGVPDLLVCCNKFFVAVEVKASNGKPSELQLWNIEKIKEAGGIALVLYPDGFEEFKRIIESINRVGKS